MRGCCFCCSNCVVVVLRCVTKGKKMVGRPRAYTRISDDKRALIITWHALGRSYQEIATHLHVAASTAHKIVQRHNEGAPPDCQHGHPKVMLEEDRDFMLDLIREEPTTLATLQNVCHDVNGRWFSLPTICWHLDEFEFSFKCIILVDEHPETPENLAKRAGYARDIAMRLCVNHTTVFDIDEVGFNLSMCRAYGHTSQHNHNTV